jgi:phosphohistidine phosphatase
MGQLIIMRHAEAAVADAGADDYARPLTAAGRVAAERAAARIRAQHGVPLLLLHSPAIRTAETARIVARSLAGSSLRLLALPEVYLARGNTLQQLLALPTHAAPSVLLIGHNPGVSELLQILDPEAARERRWLTPAEFVAVDA